MTAAVGRVVDAAGLATSQVVNAVEYMKNLMVDGDEDEDVRLHLASVCGDEEGVRLALQEGAAEWINHRVRPYLAPPLRLAVNGGSGAVVQLLVGAGADIELEDVKGQTPLFVATSSRNPQLMKVLLEAGANPEGSRKNRCSPLLVAVRDGFSEGAKLLLEYGADPEPFDQVQSVIPGWPLQHAVVYAHFACFLELLRGGAEANLTSLTHPVAPGVLARLSLPHAILKYAKDYPEFVRLYYESGGNLRQAGQRGETCTEEFPADTPARREVLALLGSPRSLKSICRTSIRRHCGKRNLKRLHRLEIPACLIPYLNYDEYTKYVTRTPENTHVKLDKEE